MEIAELIDRLVSIKKAITQNEDGAVADTIWMLNPNEGSVCEEIDHLLSKLGMSAEEIDSQY